MKNTREKLIDLLNAITECYRFDAWENADKIADYLIANGVRLETKQAIKTSDEKQVTSNQPDIPMTGDVIDIEKIEVE